MTQVTDLSWQQLESALGGVGAISVVGDPPNQKIMIDVSVICRNGCQDLSDVGVIELISRLFFAARDAQVAVNAGLPVGEKINAFLQPTQVIQADGSVLVTQQLQIKVSVAQNLNGVKAPTI